MACPVSARGPHNRTAQIRHFSGLNPAHPTPRVSHKASSDHTNRRWTISCPFSLSDRVYCRVSRMEVAMRRFSQRVLQWFFMFGVLALVLTCFVLAG